MTIATSFLTVAALAGAFIQQALESADPGPGAPSIAAAPARLAWIDFDGDDRLDVLLRLPDGRATLLRGRPDGSFEDAGALVGLDLLRDVGALHARDYDGDGRLDVLAVGQGVATRLLRQGLDGVLVDSTELAGLVAREDVVHAEWLDYDRDGAPDLLLSRVHTEELYHGDGRGGFAVVDLGLDPRAPFGGASWSQDSTARDARALTLTLNELERRAAESRAAAGVNPAVEREGPRSATTPRGSRASDTPSGGDRPAGGEPLAPGDMQRGPGADGSPPLTSCADELEDQAGGACLGASSVPTLGLLYPQTELFNVDPATGFVGINKLGGDTRLHVNGNSRVVSNANMGSSVGQGAFQIVNIPYSEGLSFSSAGLQSIGTDLLVNPDNLHGLIVNDGALHVTTAGRVGIGRVPDQAMDLDVNGIVRAGDTIVSTKAAGAPFQIASSDHVANLNADRLDGFDAADFSQFGAQVDEAELADEALTDAKVSSGAAIQGFKVVPNFGTQDVLTRGWLRAGAPGFGSSVPQAPLHALGVSEATLAGGGGLILGEVEFDHLVLDTNEIQAVDEADEATLYLNPHGGDVTVAGRIETGFFRMSAGAGPGKVLTADGAGNGTWQTVPGGGGPDGDWQITGNDMVSGVTGGVGIGGPPAFGKLSVDAGTGDAGFFRSAAATGLQAVGSTYGLNAVSPDPGGVGIFGSGETGLFVQGWGSSTPAVRAWGTQTGPALLAEASGGTNLVLDQSGNGRLIEGFVGGSATPSFRVDSDGRVVCSVLEITGGADLVESFDTGAEPVEPGSVLVIDAENPGRLTLAREAYDTKVAGVVSGAGGVRPGIELAQADVLEGDTPVAMAGRVWVRCSAEGGAIRPGDLLTTAATPGHAMRAADRERGQGAVLGKAMSALDEGAGLVLVLVNLQ